MQGRQVSQGIHFISGLPRSGSTLLAGLLRQNPRFSASVNSPVFHLFVTLQMAMSGRSEFHSFFSEQQRVHILRGLFDNYYEDVCKDHVVFDTNRAWCSKIAALDRLFPNAKIICCVRPIPEILDSIERVLRDNALETSRMFNFEGITNVYSRADILNATPTGTIGSAYAGLREAFHGPFSHKLLLVTYESLAKRPAETLKEIYDFIGEKSFEHNFDNVEFDASEYDSSLGMRGLHRVHKSVQYGERPNLLPPDLVKRFHASAFWEDSALTRDRVRVL